MNDESVRGMLVKAGVLPLEDDAKIVGDQATTMANLMVEAKAVMAAHASILGRDPEDDRLDGASLTGPAIVEAVENGMIFVDPWDPDSVGPCSLDLTLGPIVLRLADETVDTHHPPNFVPVQLTSYNGGQEFFLLEPGEFYLGHTNERVRLEGLDGIVFGRSGGARFNVEVESAGFVDDGYDGQITLEMKVTKPTWLYVGDRICQIRFTRLFGRRSPYRGRYNGSVGPVPPLTLAGKGHRSGG